MEHRALITRAGQNNQMTLFSGVLPTLQLFQAVAPVSTATKQPDNHDLSRACRAAQIMINLSWVSQAAEIKSSDLVPPRLKWRGIETMGECAEVGAGAREQQHVSRRLLDEHHILWRVKPWATGEAVHDAILPITGLA